MVIINKTNTYSVQCILYFMHYISNIARRTRYNVHCTLYIVHIDNIQASKVYIIKYRTLKNAYYMANSVKIAYFNFINLLFIQLSYYECNIFTISSTLYWV